ncbi:hypothetical protein RJ639_026621, partial [Escallonia herrerae]
TARGCGWQKIGAFVNLAAYYFVGLPAAIILTFLFHFGGKVRESSLSGIFHCQLHCVTDATSPFAGPLDRNHIGEWSSSTAAISYNHEDRLGPRSKSKTFSTFQSLGAITLIDKSLLSQAEKARYRVHASSIPTVMMNLTRSITTRTRACLFSFLISLCILLSYTSYQSTGWSSLCASTFPLLGALVFAGLIIAILRTTLVAWITVLVLLVFAGKRRRVLVVEGRKITTDIAVFLVKVVIKEKGLLAVACATILSSMAFGFVKES